MLHHGPWKDLTRVPQGQKVVIPGGLHSQPGRNRQTFVPCRLQATGETYLELS